MLDERLNRVMGYIIGDTLVDIGSDHAYLPIEAYHNDKIKFAVCGEVVEGPYQSTVNNIRQHELSDKIEARLGNGLKVLNNEDVDTITICGMGGPLIAQILKEGFGHVGNHPRLILQANTYTYPVRKVISELGYTITNEDVLKDGRHFYEIIVCDFYPKQKNYTEKELKFGPVNLENRTEAFIDKLNWELEHHKRILKGIDSTAEKNTEKIDELNLKISERHEVLNSESQ